MANEAQPATIRQLIPEHAYRNMRGFTLWLSRRRNAWRRQMLGKRSGMGIEAVNDRSRKKCKGKGLPATLDCGAYRVAKT